MTEPSTRSTAESATTATMDQVRSSVVPRPGSRTAPAPQATGTDAARDDLVDVSEPPPPLRRWYSQFHEGRDGWSA
jgi:hypothetical protein